MDSVVSWFILTALAYIGFFHVLKKREKEKAEYNAENDAFFREYDKKFK